MKAGSKNACLAAAAVLCLALAACVQKPTVPPGAGPTPAELAARQAAEAAAVAQAAQLAEWTQIADEAYVFGYPLISSEMHRLQMSNVAKPVGQRAPLNSFWHARRLTQPGERHPLLTDADTLASFAWLDLGQEALLFSYPDMGKRYFSFGLHSLWMPALATFGSRSGGGKAATLLISGPGWQGQVPKGVRHVPSPTRYLAILGRIQAGPGEADQRNVNALQARLRIAPLPARAKPPGPASPTLETHPDFSTGDTPRQLIAAMDAASYFNLLARLMASAAPPAAQDAAMLQKMARIGLEPGKAFDLPALEPALQAVLQATGPRAMAQIVAHHGKLFTSVNGWQLPLTSGEFGTDYLSRAAVAAFDWPGTLPQEILQMTTRVDAAGRALNGAFDYTLRFAKGQAPPVDAFWSLTMRAEANGRAGLVPNTAERFSLRSRDKLVPDADGALTLQVQSFAPGFDNSANWLPAPRGDFTLVLRLYHPRPAAPSALPPGQGTWAAPPLRRAD
jgi:hypothetical protein